MRPRILFCAAFACSALWFSALGVSVASASRGQALFFEGGSDLLSAKTRPHALATLESMGVKALRVELEWFLVAPGANSAKRPSFQATNPTSYNWGEYAPLLAEAAKLHWKVLLTVRGPAPRWATSNHTAPYVTRPNSHDFQEFMTAVGKEFSSEVSLFAIWNEPNDASFLLPQFNANGTPASPSIYRHLYLAGYAGLQAAGIANPKVLMGETAPVGFDTIKASKNPKYLLHDVAPLDFLRGALCLNSHYKKVGSCAPLHLSGYAHHAYTTGAGPYYKPPNPDNVTIGVLGRLVKALDLAADAGAIKAGMPIYLTEFGIQSKPNQFFGVPAPQQAEYYAISEHIAYENPRVAAFSQYLLRDDPTGGKPGSIAHGGTVGFQSGLEYVNGQHKPLFASFPLPLVVTKTGAGFSLWGLVRPATGSTTVTVLVEPKGSKHFHILKTAKTNSLGYWSSSSSTQGVAWRVRWQSPTGVKYEGAPIRAYRPGSDTPAT